jgi:broad specificity phosphatase PhoE
MQELTAADMVSRYGAEDPDRFCARILTALDELSNRSSDGLVVSHSGVARMILARAAGLPSAEFRQLPMLGNAAPFLVERHPYCS